MRTNIWQVKSKARRTIVYLGVHVCLLARLTCEYGACRWLHHCSHGHRAVCTHVFGIAERRRLRFKQTSQCIGPFLFVVRIPYSCANRTWISRFVIEPEWIKDLTALHGPWSVEDDVPSTTGWTRFLLDCCQSICAQGQEVLAWKWRVKRLLLNVTAGDLRVADSSWSASALSISSFSFLKLNLGIVVGVVPCSWPLENGQSPDLSFLPHAGISGSYPHIQSICTNNLLNLRSSGRKSIHLANYSPRGALALLERCMQLSVESRTVPVQIKINF